MSSSADILTFKELFLEKNQMFTEIELTDESKPMGKLQEFDILENEIWMLQCPKGMNIMEFESQKFKIPGRTNISNSEAISMEFNKGIEQHAFVYCNRKGRYSLRLLPVRGTIVVRDRLKAAETITNERDEECFPPFKRVPVPSGIRTRHPLLGVRYDDKLILDKSIIKRLQKADEISANVLKESLIQKLVTSEKHKSTRLNKSLSIEINGATDEDDDVEFINEEKLKKKNKNKRKNSESLLVESEGNLSIKKKKISRKTKKNDETVSKDLEWLQNI